MNRVTLAHLRRSQAEPVVSIAGGDLSELLDSYRALRLHSITAERIDCECSGCLARFYLRPDADGRMPWMITGDGWVESSTSPDFITAAADVRTVIRRRMP
jgi:hypothetical protein